MNQFRIGFASGLVVFLYAVIFFGLAAMLAKRYPDKPLSVAWQSMFN